MKAIMLYGSEDPAAPAPGEVTLRLHKGPRRGATILVTA